MSITTTGKEQEFDYGIKNNVSELDNDAPFVVVQGTDGTYGKASVNNLPLSIATINALKNKADLSTGLLKNGLVQTNTSTTFNIMAGVGIISNFDDPDNPTSTIISFPAFTAITPAYLTTSNITYVAINSSSAVVMQASPFTNVQRRDLIILGAVIHSNLSTINLVNNISAPSNAGVNQLHDFMEAIGALNVSGNKYSANGANLLLNKSAGVIFKEGVNFANNWKDPHNLSIASGAGLSFRYRTQNGTEGSDVSSLNPAVYDLANVLTSVPSNKFTIQTVTLFQTGATRIQYGQSVYNTLADAEAAILTRNFIVEPNIAANGIVRAYIILRNNSADLTNTTTSKIIEAQKFGGIVSGGAAVTDTAIIAALGYTPANDADVVKLTGNQSIYGTKFFNDAISTDTDITINGGGSYVLNQGTYTTGINAETLTANRGILLPNASGTIALTASPTFTGTPTAPTATVGTNTTQLATTAFVLANSACEIGLACSDETSNLATGLVTTFRMPYAMTLSSVRISLTDAPTISTLIVDVKQGGTSIFSTLVSIDASELTSTTAATPAVITTTALTDDSLMTIHITQIGSGNTGKGLKVLLTGKKS